MNKMFINFSLDALTGSSVFYVARMSLQQCIECTYFA